jgi:putative transposase
MPWRKTPLVDDEYYHVFNRGVDRRNIFITQKEFSRAIRCLDYYRHFSPPVSFSQYLNSNIETKTKLKQRLIAQPLLVDIVCFCLMNNHYHLVLKQNLNNGISRFMNNFQNSYSRYFNTRRERTGTLFQSRFKAVHIDTDAQLLHLSRYIHLNPLSAGMATIATELVE